MPYKLKEDKRLADQRFAETHHEYVLEQGRKSDRKRSKTEKRKAYMRKWWKDHPDKRKYHNERNRFFHHADMARRKKEWYEKNKDRILQMRKDYYQKNKEVLLPQFMEYYQENKDKFRGYAHKYRINNLDDCRRRSREWAKREYQKNPDKFKARSIDSQTRRRRLIRLASEDPFEMAKVILHLKTAKDTKCAYCGKDIFGGDVQIDHYYPLSRGGRHAIDNIKPACITCNSSKRDKTPYEWEQYQLMLSNRKDK